MTITDTTKTRPALVQVLKGGLNTSFVASCLSARAGLFTLDRGGNMARRKRVLYWVARSPGETPRVAKYHSTLNHYGYFGGRWTTAREIRPKEYIYLTQDYPR